MEFSAPPAKTLVTISRDQPLQSTRTLLLEQAGYSVIPLGTDASVHAFLKSPDQPAINLVLLCHSVPEASRVVLCRAFKSRHPRTPVLMLYNGYDPTSAPVDGRLENMLDPQALLDTLQVLLSPNRTGS